MRLTRPPINLARFQAAVLLLQRWLGFLLVWLATLNIRRTPAELKRAERRLKQLIVASAFAPGKPQINFRVGARRRIGRSHSGSRTRLLMRGLLPKLSRFQFDRAARIAHVGRNIARYVRKFQKRVARGLLMILCARRGTAPIALISNAPAPSRACADTS